ncbi:opioid growth factor receptor-related protein [Vibrio crassostreae]|uniref:opioid growth factor receptor-related protein n=1 Tax=Vibrio crassostreae TaxID=246167 RepID=UPI001B313EBD|nr:opioid growth factor receptor-related protein [Vibrio crassostreae]
MSKLTQFHLGMIPDSQGRLINEIWALDDFWLEYDHKYIQWLFPIDTQTKFNRHAPVLTLEDRITFVQNDKLKAAQLTSLELMLGFFGMKMINGHIVASEELNIKDHIWLKHGGHNHLRISRIIRSLALCGQFSLSQTFQLAMIETAENFGEVDTGTLRYWLEANILE